MWFITVNDILIVLEFHLFFPGSHASFFQFHRERTLSVGWKKTCQSKNKRKQSRTPDCHCSRSTLCTTTASAVSWNTSHTSTLMENVNAKATTQLQIHNTTTKTTQLKRNHSGSERPQMSTMKRALLPSWLSFVKTQSNQSPLKMRCLSIWGVTVQLLFGCSKHLYRNTSNRQASHFNSCSLDAYIQDLKTVSNSACLIVNIHGNSLPLWLCIQCVDLIFFIDVLVWDISATAIKCAGRLPSLFGRDNFKDVRN